MIGNDVVDLRYALKESNWKRKGYLDKIYTFSEQELIHSASNPDLMVWIIWSMKEATYKAHNRMTAIREYAPTKIICDIEAGAGNVLFGNASYNNLEYKLKIFIFREYIHTIALYNSSDFSAVNIITVESYPVDYISYLKQNNFLMAFESITKNEFGIPNLYNEITNEIKPISISHHGNFLSLISIKD